MPTDDIDASAPSAPCIRCNARPRIITRIGRSAYCIICAHDNLVRVLALWDAQDEIDALYTDLGGEA